MGIKLRHFFLTSFIIFGFLSLSLQPIEAATRSWDVDDIVIWGTESRVAISVTDLVENVATSDFVVSQDEMKYNITYINTISKEYDAITITAGGISFINDRDYGSSDFVNDELTPDDFYSGNFVWDYEHNVTVCEDFSFDLNVGSRYLIEPNWESINNAFIDLVDGEHLIDTVADPYLPITHNITLTDIVSENDILFMGENDFTAAQAKFEPTTTLWTFEFNLSNYVKYSQWNGTMNIYTPYEVYCQSLLLNFTDGGILSTFTNRIEYIITLDNIRTTTETEVLIVLGGRDKLPNYDEEQTITITNISGASFFQFIFFTATSFTISIIVYKRRRK